MWQRNGRHGTTPSVAVAEVQTAEPIRNDTDLVPAIHEPTPGPPAPAGTLLRVLGVGFGFAVTIGGTVGMGILRNPGEVAAQLPDPWWFLGAWAAGGLYALLGALAVAELATLIPRAGGFYAFARHAFGPYPGFVIGWSDWLAVCGSAAAVALVAGEYAGALVPGLAGQGVAVALAALGGFVVLQARGIRWGGHTQGLTSLAKALALVVLVACCFAFGKGPAAAESGQDAGPVGFPSWVACVLALQAVIYTFDGWYAAAYFAEEVRDPARSLPRSMVGSVLLVLTLYLLVNLALLWVLPFSQLMGQRLALGAAAEAVFGARGTAVTNLLALLILLGTLSACLLTAPRILFALSRDGLFARRAVWVSAQGTPTVALLVSAAVAALFLLTGTFERVLGVLTFFMVTNYAAAFVAVFVLRRREPDAARPYRAWGHPWTTGLALAGSLAFLAGAVAHDAQNSLVALALLAGSYPVFLLLGQTGGRRTTALTREEGLAARAARPAG